MIPELNEKKEVMLFLKKRAIKKFPDLKEDVCEFCEDVGIKDGCPKCGLRPVRETKISGKTTYALLTVIDVNDDYYKKVLEIKKRNTLRIIISPALNRKYVFKPNSVEVWIAVEDMEKARGTGVLFWEKYLKNS